MGGPRAVTEKVILRLLLLCAIVGSLAALAIYTGVQVEKTRRIETAARIDRERLDRERVELEQEMFRRYDRIADELTLAASRDCQILAEVQRQIDVAKATFEQENRALYRQMAEALQSSAAAEQKAREALQRSQQAQALAQSALIQSQAFFYQPLHYPTGYGAFQSYGSPFGAPVDAARYRQWLATNQFMNIWAANLFPWSDYERVAQVHRMNPVREKHGLPLRSVALRNY
jgi:hypothetical protein